MNEHIISYIKDNYINSQMSPQFAVLVKGDWGCGKTFLVKKILEETYGKKYEANIIWISVYGLSSIQQLKQKLLKKIHPILTNKVTQFVFNTLKTGIKTSTKIDLNNDEEGDLFFDLTIPDYETEKMEQK